MDPLKPFSSSIRTLWDSSARRASQTDKAVSPNSAGNPQPTSPIAPAPPPQSLHSRLRTRLATISSWDASRAREVFVESVMLSELGDHLSSDPAFGSIVRRVSNELGANSLLSKRLDDLLLKARNGSPIV